MYAEVQKSRESEEKVLLKEIEEQKRELMRREEKLRDIEAKLVKSDISMLQPAKGSTRESANRSHRSSGDHGSPLQGNRRARPVNGDYGDEDDRPKVNELVV